MRKGSLRIAGSAAAFAALAMLSACSYVSMRTIQYIGVPRYPPSDPNKVVILHERPKGGETRLGEVIVDASVDPPPKVEEIEAKIRQGTAQLGGDAAVLVVDRTQTVGAVVMGPWWDRSVSAVEGRVVVAVAIKLK
jgi:hypothetical protein